MRGWSVLAFLDSKWDFRHRQSHLLLHSDSFWRRSVHHYAPNSADWVPGIMPFEPDARVRGD